MINSLRIKNYRCLNNFYMEDIKPITIFVGRNNVGKSAILEAISLVYSGNFAWYDAFNKDILNRIIKKRGGIKFSELMINLNSDNCEISASTSESDSENKYNMNLFITKKFGEFIERINDDELSEIINEFKNSLIYFENHIKNILEKKVNFSSYEKKSKFEKITSIFNSLYNEHVENFKVYLIFRNNLNKTHSFGFIGKSKFISSLVKKINQIYKELVGANKFFYPLIYRRIDDIFKVSSKNKENSNILFLDGFSTFLIEKIYDTLIENKKISGLLNILKRNFDFIVDLRKTDKGLMVLIKDSDKSLNLGSFGDGFINQLLLLSLIASLNNGILLLEEPENKLHPGYMGILSSEIINSIERYNIQYFISTHSLEFIQFLLENNPDVIKIVRLYKIDNEFEIDYEILDGYEALEDLNVLRLDLRGI
ncbi:MAG: AAA family ATPase [Candidatus Helarchaeota archaeon]